VTVNEAINKEYILKHFTYLRNF